MFPEGNDDEPKLEYGEDLEEEITDYSHVTKHPYTSKIFCWIGTRTIIQRKETPSK